MIIENALALIRAGKIEEAEAELHRLQAENGKSADWQAARGLVMEANGMVDEAVQLLEAAHQLDAENREAAFHLARVLDLHGSDDRAMACYQEVVGESPVHVNALLNLAVLYEDREQFEDALDCVERILVEYPNHTRARLFLKDIKSSLNMLYDETQDQSREQQSAMLDTPISDFELSVRSRNCLKKMNINNLGDLLRITEAELLSYKNFGETSLEEIRAMLHQKGLHIGQLKEDGQKAVRPAPVRQAPSQGSPEVLNRLLSEIEFSGRSRKCLQRLGLVTMGDLTMKTEAELLAAKNFGQTSLNEVKQKLAEFGLSLRK
jgi:DNA-directed RNA polymerase subunit alpha